MSKDYIHSVVGLLEDAMTDRDHVHRQTACAIIRHLTIGVAGLGYEEALTHLLNLVWPNIFETSPHVIGAVMDAIEAMRIGIGSGVVLSYVLQGLFHPSRRVREVYWRMYSKSFVSKRCLFALINLFSRHPCSRCRRRFGPILPRTWVNGRSRHWTGLYATPSDDVGLN